MTDLTIPVYVDFNFQFSKIVHMYIDLGAKLHMNMSNKIDKAEGKAYVYGIYPQYDNLRMDEHWGYNGFGNQTFSNKTLEVRNYYNYSYMEVLFDNEFLRIGVFELIFLKRLLLLI